MRKSIIICLVFLSFLLILPFEMEAQVGVNNTNTDPDPSAMLDVKSTEKGLLMPRMTTSERDAISNPAMGLMIYNVEDSCFHYFSGKEWVKDCGQTQQVEPFNQAVSGSTGNDQGNAVATDQTGNLYVVGTFSGTTSFGSIQLTSAGGSDIFLAKYDPEGNTIWAINIGDVKDEKGMDVSLDQSGNIFVSATFRQFITIGDTTFTGFGSSNNEHLLFIKLDPMGGLLWVRSALRNTDASFLSRLGNDMSGNVYVVGTYRDSISFGDTVLFPIGVDEEFIAKYSASGQLLWAKDPATAPNPGSGWFYLEDIFVDDLGASYITGPRSTSLNFGNLSVIYNPIYVVKLNASGQPIWKAEVYKQSGNTLYTAEQFVTGDIAGNIYLTSSFNGSFSINGTTYHSEGSGYGNHDIVITKISPTGQFLWSNAMIGKGDNEAKAIAVDAIGNSYITGFIQDTVNVGGTQLISSGARDIFIAKFDANGQLSWLTQGESNPTNAEGLGIAVNNDNVYVTGYFNGQIKFGGDLISSVGGNDVLLWGVNGTDGTPLELAVDASLSDLQDGDSDPSNEFQTLSLSGTDLSISDGNSVDLASIDSDDQTLDLSGTNLSISDGNSVDLTSINTDDQTLGLSGTNLSISDGNSVDLTTIGSDDQGIDKFNLNGTILELSLEDDGQADQTVNLSGLKDNLGNHTATQNFQLSGNWLSHNNTNAGIFIDASNQVGIGTNSPSRPLTIRGINATSEIMAMEDNTGTAKWHVNLKDGGVNFAETAVADGRFFIKEGGNIGIGTSLPETDLEIEDVGPEIRLTDPRSGSASFWNEGTLLGRLSFYNLDDPAGTTTGSIDMVTDNGTTHPDGRLEFRTAINNTPTTKMVINASGNVGIGLQNPTALLEVNSSVAKKVGGGSWTASSDRRLKENIANYEEGLSEVLRIRPVRFHYNELSGYDTTETHIGIIAQELQKIAPYMVDTFEKDGTEYLEVDNSAMTYMLINATQEQQKRIEMLEKENDLLLKKVQNLKMIESRLQTLEAMLLESKKTPLPQK